MDGLLFYYYQTCIISVDYTVEHWHCTGVMVKFYSFLLVCVQAL